MTHTPGPWNAHHIMVNAPNGYLVATTNPIGHVMEHAKANARLIAAAPELLAALHEILNAYVPDWTLPEHTDIGGSVMHARAAIAKATGTP